jgi:hypothetical protein
MQQAFTEAQLHHWNGWGPYSLRLPEDYTQRTTCPKGGGASCTSRDIKQVLGKPFLSGAEQCAQSKTRTFESTPPKESPRIAAVETPLTGTGHRYTGPIETYGAHALALEDLAGVTPDNDTDTLKRRFPTTITINVGGVKLEVVHWKLVGRNGRWMLRNTVFAKRPPGSPKTLVDGKRTVRLAFSGPPSHLPCSQVKDMRAHLQQLGVNCKSIRDGKEQFLLRPELEVLFEKHNKETTQTATDSSADVPRRVLCGSYSSEADDEHTPFDGRTQGLTVGIHEAEPGLWCVTDPYDWDVIRFDNVKACEVVGLFNVAGEAKVQELDDVWLSAVRWPRAPMHRSTNAHPSLLAFHRNWLNCKAR